jgi:hypothetical protein
MAIDTQNKVWHLIGNLFEPTGTLSLDASLLLLGVYPFETLSLTIPPDEVLNFNRSAGDGYVGLFWTNPSDFDFDGTMIRYSAASYPVDETDGLLLIDQSGNPDEDQFYYDTAAPNDALIYYTIFSYDTLLNYSSGVNALAYPRDSSRESGLNF